MFGKEKNEKRFVIKEKQVLYSSEIHIVVDTHTGVNYLMTTGVGKSGMTPLLDSEGKVVIDK